jgi:peptide deformylase
MAVRPIILYPDVRLKAVCDLVSPAAASLVVQDLLDTMNAGPPRTVGIAAPQVGHLVRVAVVDTSRNPKYPEGNGLLVLVNPTITRTDGDQVFREGCLSLPEYTANIHRAAGVSVTFLGLDGMQHSIDAEGFEAVVLQHEIDHLDGLLFLDRVADAKNDVFRRKGT